MQPLAARKTGSNGVRTMILSESKPACQAESVSWRGLSRGGRAERAARLCALADALAPTDRALIRWAYGDGKPLGELAAVHRVTTRAMSRRLQRLARRCESAEFGFVLSRVRTWEPPLALVARACVLEGRSLRSAAATLGMGIHQVRALRTVVLSMARGVEQNDQLAARWRKV